MGRHRRSAYDVLRLERAHRHYSTNPGAAQVTIGLFEEKCEAQQKAREQQKIEEFKVLPCERAGIKGRMGDALLAPRTRTMDSCRLRVCSRHF